MDLVPKFIPADKVREKAGDGKEMYIKQLIKTECKDNSAKYSRMLVCYWFENGAPKRDIFHEDDLELARGDQYFAC